MKSPEYCRNFQEKLECVGAPTLKIVGVTLESIREDMKVLPPGKSGEDKFYVGFFDGSMLTAVMDLILKYPNDETAFIGLFMVDSAS